MLKLPLARYLFDAACAVNQMRPKKNKRAIGSFHPQFPPQSSPAYPLGKVYLRFDQARKKAFHRHLSQRRGCIEMADDFAAQNPQVVDAFLNRLGRQIRRRQVFQKGPYRCSTNSSCRAGTHPSPIAPSIRPGLLWPCCLPWGTVRTGKRKQEV
jgi:hypothetical protein